MASALIASSGSLCRRRHRCTRVVQQRLTAPEVEEGAILQSLELHQRVKDGVTDQARGSGESDGKNWIEGSGHTGEGQVS
ncbi:unnamed protein product [Lactuca virosa]|uniref:Uncharacterized protein n=1 Tax=Lactuca virosa TaxID=75947 RepID=A0AAU9NIX7_9ASTR|nr:unnamed protein product [Lactuca virosa]